MVARALPAGLVDVIVAGHTHAAMAHRVGEIAVIESYANGRAFGRIDLRISPSGIVTAKSILQPQDLCPLGTGSSEGSGEPVEAAACQPGIYEGAPVTIDAAVAAIIAPSQEIAATVEAQPLGVTFTTAIPRGYDVESALGNLFTDLMLAASPKAQVALTNGGGLRADLPAGALHYGALYQAMPFDNRLAIVTLTGAHLRRLISSPSSSA